jgi:hypothetical protein
MHPHEYGLTRAAYSVNETLALLSTSRASLYGRLIPEGQLTPVKLGKKTLFLAPDIAAFLDRLRTGAKPETPKAA